MKSVFSVLVIVSLSFNCSGIPELSPEVCEVGEVVCNISKSICNTLDVPDQLCNYLDFACSNLNLICSTSSDSVEHQTAKQELKKANANLNDWLKNYKKSNNDSLKVIE